MSIIYPLSEKSANTETVSAICSQSDLIRLTSVFSSSIHHGVGYRFSDV